MKAMFGQSSWQTMTYNSDTMRVYEIQLSMSEHVNHNVVFPFDALLTVTEGQVFLATTHEETTLKANQAAWLKHNQGLRCVAVTPVVRLFVVVFNNQQTRIKATFERFASGTEHKQKRSSGITHWTVENKDLGKIEWIMLPAHHKEPMYYLKQSEQFILPLNYNQSLSLHQERDIEAPIEPCGIVIPPGCPRRLINRASKPITFLSITTPYPSRGRILKLTAQTASTSEV